MYLIRASQERIEVTGASGRWDDRHRIVDTLRRRPVVGIPEMSFFKWVENCESPDLTLRVTRIEVGSLNEQPSAPTFLLYPLQTIR